jgi:HD-GYP domain-containing protein (c-di-GMP phosphodiesterase class II)
MKLGSGNNSNTPFAATAQQSTGARAQGSNNVAPPPLAAAALPALAARFRQAGLMLAAALPDGTIAYHDPEAAAFFTKFVLPQLRQAPLPDHNGAFEPSIAHLAGCLVGVAPYFERKVRRKTILLAARADDFALTEDVLRAAGRLHLDGPWLLSQAKQLPGYGDESVLAQARLLPGMLADQIKLDGMSRELESMSAQLAHSYEEISLIYQISSGMKVNRRAADFFRQACQEVLAVMSTCSVGFGLKNDLLQQAAPPELCGEHALQPAQVARLAAELMSALARRDGALIVHDVAADPTFRWLAATTQARQLLAVPLQRDDQTLGCLFALDKPTGEFDSVDAKLLNSIANETSIYVENARLFEDVHGLMMGLLLSLTSAVDAKDAYTCGHSERVALVSRHIAQQTGLSDKDVEQVYMAGLLHDVGKIGVPEAVLQKPGRLTPEEFEQIKLHPAIGAKILQDVKQIQGIIPGVLHHHERYDGKGYPSRLAGERIPLMGRIICLADCFDAMTSSRTYRKGLPIEVAMAEIRRCAGTHFDPRLAEVFLRTGHEGLRELLSDHQRKSKQLRDPQDALRMKTA